MLKRVRLLAKSGTEAVVAERFLLPREERKNPVGAHHALELLVLRLACSASEGNIGGLMVPHDLNLAARFAEVVVLLENGTVRAAGSPTEIVTEIMLSQVYGTPVRIEMQGTLGRLVVHTE